MFQPVTPNVDVQQLEADQLEFWKAHDIFHRTMRERAGGPHYVFYEGPPTANGKPGTHHVLARAFKDMFPRYKTMNGYYVLRKGGWDTHGLPVEIEVEKQLGFEHKWQIEEYGIAAFNQKCKESVFKYIKDWEVLTERIAFWVDLDDAYVTFTNDYIQSVWWILRQYWDQGLLYQGHKVVPYCPRCGTPLSSHEVNQGYEDNTPDPSVYVRFRTQDDPNTFFLVWTTTPWTLPGNVALAVGDDVDYVKVRGQNENDQTETLIVAGALLRAQPAPPKKKAASQDGEEEAVDEDRARTEVVSRLQGYEVVERLKGRDLLGARYEPLFRFLPVEQDYAYVVSGDFVSTSTGTGIVHMAPAFGADDMAVGRKYNLPVLMTVKPNGAFVDEVTPWANVWVKDADPQIEKDLKSRGLLFATGKYLHTYPFCWRCATPLLYYARPTWYIRTSERKDDLVSLNRTINWVPEHIKEGRFGDWLENNVDWALGRERYWGTPLPVWVCDYADCLHMHCVGGVEELSRLTGQDQSALDLHRPYVDEVTWACDVCHAGTMRRVPELIDVWFDSGAMPVAQWGYPYHNKEMFESQFPADFICEAIDQTRGWFYSLHAISTLLFKSVAYKNVICLGHILDENGRKASKSLGNVVDPWSVIEPYGADAFRWYMYTASAPGDSRRFSVNLVGQTFRSFYLTLWNTYSFFVTYANLDGFNPAKAAQVPPSERSLLDRWALARLHSMMRDVTGAYESYDVTGATRPVEKFVGDLSNWYVRRSRSRFWRSGDDRDKASAYLTLYECLVTVAKLLAPAMPFLSEALHRNLVGSVDQAASDSVHLAWWPQAERALIDQELLDEMDVVMRLVSLGHAARNEAGVKVRQPLAAVAYSVPGGRSEVVSEYADLIADELNVKRVMLLDSAEDVVTYSLNPLPKVLGPKYGQDFPKIQKMLREGDASRYARTLLAGQAIRVQVNGAEAELTPNEVEVRRSPAAGYAVAEDAGYLAALDVTLTDELVEEGLAREFIRRVQTQRKEAGFNVDDRIAAEYAASDRLARAVQHFAEMIERETLSTSLNAAAKPQGEKVESYEFDAERLTLGVRRA